MKWFLRGILWTIVLPFLLAFWIGVSIWQKWYERQDARARKPYKSNAPVTE